MRIHQMHDTSDHCVMKMMGNHLSTITDDKIIRNYHPDYKDCNENLFYLLENGRYRVNHGKYFIIEDSGEYICSAGWNEYDLNPEIAIALSRMYVNRKYRARYFVGKNILPLILEETIEYSKVWITANAHNRMITEWFSRSAEGKRATLFNQWPDIYKQFRPIGKQEVYYTIQDVIELQR